MENSSDAYDGRIDWNGHEDIRTSMQASTALGNSFKGSNLSSLMSNVNYSVVCGIEVQNWAKFDLIKPILTVRTGHVSLPPVSIRNGTKEAMIAHKYGYVTKGSSGLVSWLVRGMDKRIFVMWSSPYFGSNTLAVGITKDKQTYSETWFDQIEKNSKSSHQEFEHKYAVYKWTVSEIMAEDETFQVVGAMGTSSKTQIRVVFRPKDIRNLSNRHRSINTRRT